MDILSCVCYLVLSVASQHLGATGLNQTNPGVGLEINGYHVGEYRNSLSRTSWYAGKDWTTAGPVRAGVLAGIVTGYRQKWETYAPVYGFVNGVRQQTGFQALQHTSGSGVLPLLAPFVSADFGAIGANLALLPNPWKVSESAIALQIKVKL